LACITPIHWVRVDAEWEGGRGSTAQVV